MKWKSLLVVVVVLFVGRGQSDPILHPGDPSLPVFSKAELAKAQKEVETEMPVNSHGAAKQFSKATCEDPEYIDFGLRLIGCDGRLSPQAGRLEVYYKNQWGTVCDDNFDILDAQVACYSLGFMSGEGLFLPGTFQIGTGLIVLDDLNCTGTERKLDECPHSAWAVHNCYHTEDVSISCAASDMDSRFGYKTRLVSDNNETVDAGRLEIFHEECWGTVCDDFFDNTDAAVACRAMDKNYATGIFRENDFGPGTGRIWIDTLMCTTADYNIGNCAHDPWGLHDCDHEEDVSIECGNCFDIYCQNGGRCADKDTVQCICLPGFTGLNCETIIDTCLSEPCQNGGTCISYPGSFACDCPPLFTGNTCQDPVTSPTTTTSTTTRTTTTTTSPPLFSSVKEDTSTVTTDHTMTAASTSEATTHDMNPTRSSGFTWI